MTERTCGNCGTKGCGHDDARRCGVHYSDWTQKEIRMSKQMMEWKNAFEELPPPNVPVLAFIPAYGGGDKNRRIRAMYAPAKTLEVSDDADGGEYDESTDTYYCEAGWYETNEYEDTHWSVGDRVTHWMPLPPPPNAQ